MVPRFGGMREPVGIIESGIKNIASCKRRKTRELEYQANEIDVTGEHVGQCENVCRTGKMQMSRKTADS